MTKHKHVWTALRAVMGPYGQHPKQRHLHQCFTESCGWLLVGDGEDCDGDPETHWLVSPRQTPDSALHAKTLSVISTYRQRLLV
jgi:hypothetical protein